MPNTMRLPALLLLLLMGCTSAPVPVVPAALVWLLIWWGVS